MLATLRARTEAEAAARALEELSRSAEHDALTGLPSRVLLLDRFAGAMAHARRHGTRFALLFLDLDNFKEINDTLGHAVGDQALKRAADCLVSSIRGADSVSRHGGDEFLILLTEMSQASDVVRIAQKVMRALGTPVRVGDQVLRLTASIGISIYPEDGEDADHPHRSRGRRHVPREEEGARRVRLPRRRTPAAELLAGLHSRSTTVRSALWTCRPPLLLMKPFL